MSVIGSLLATILQLFIYILIGRLIFVYVRMFARNWRPKGIMLALVELIYAITDPPLNFARRFIPPIRMGAISFDLAYIAVFLVASLLIPFVRLL
ncbi:MAG: YggT family protein [Actinobacteria bacterium]|nr:YggT family protein [Actinomycetota bacterium]